DVQRQWAESVIRAVDQVFPASPSEPVVWPQCLRYLDQAQACHTMIEYYGFISFEAANVLNRTGLYLEKHALYAEAEPLLVRAVAIREKQLGAMHPDAATSLNSLAFLYESQGRYAEAEPLYVRALAICEYQLGAMHPDTASSLNNLAGLYKSQGR